MTKIVPIESIVSKIIFLRGEKVLLDRDLAKLYRVQTKVLTEIRDFKKIVTCYQQVTCCEIVILALHI